MTPMPETDARMLNPLVLAYVGDAVHDLHVRTRLARAGGRVHALHRSATKSVCCAAQAQALQRIDALLTEAERDVVRRGRNSHARHGVPKNANPAEYAQATGLEALLGYLYLSDQRARLAAVLDEMDGQQPDSTGAAEGVPHALL